MERLTTRVKDKVYYSKGEYSPTTLCAEMETHEIRECMKKLAEYEDTGLDPWEVEKFNHSEQWQTRILLKKVAEFEEHLDISRAEVQGLSRRVNELEKDCDYWKREALKWANEIGEQRIGPLLWMDEERGK